MIIQHLTNFGNPIDSITFSHIYHADTNLHVFNLNHYDCLYGAYLKAIKESNFYVGPYDKVLIHQGHEAPFDTWYEEIILEFERHGIMRKNILISDCGSKPMPNLGVKHAFYPNFILPVHNVNVDYIPMSQRTKTFNSLSRIPKFFRLYLTALLVDKGLLPYGNITCGSGFKEMCDDAFRHMPQHYHQYRDMFPLELEKDMTNGGMWQGITDNFLNIIKDAKFYLAIETSFENAWYSKNIQFNGFWDRIFITEKTMYAFSLFQLPIILSVHGTVEHLSELGFDMFYDIINHNYDSERDPTNRIHMVSNEIERLNKQLSYDLDRPDIKIRLQNNKELAQQLNKILKVQWKNKINHWYFTP